MPVHKKQPFAVQILKAIVEDTKKNCSLSNLRLASACLLAFSGFLRFDEFANIKVSDLDITPQHLSIQIPRSKTDQLCQEAKLVIARTGAETGPVAMLEVHAEGRNQ